MYDIIINKNSNVEVLEHSSSLQGPWLFNTTISYPNDLYFNIDGIFENEDYSFSIYSIQSNEKLGYYCFFPWYQFTSQPHHPYSFGYLPDNSLGFPVGWVWINVDTYEAMPTSGIKLIIHSDISEITDSTGNPAGEELLNWLQSNATKQ